jgi:hypothetical protein
LVRWSVLVSSCSSFLPIAVAEIELWSSLPSSMSITIELLTINWMIHFMKDNWVNKN